MQHLDEGTIHAWLDGALPAEESAGVERHVAQCKECASLVAEARGMIAGASRIVSALDIVPGGVIPKSSRAKPGSSSLWRALRLTPSRAALAATLVIAASTVLTLRHDTPTKIVPTMAANAPAPVVSASPQPAAPVVDEARARQEATAPPPSAKPDQPTRERRAVVDARTQIADSARTAQTAKSSVADMSNANRAVVQGAVAAAPAAAPPANAVASGGGAVAADRLQVLAKANVDTARSLERRKADSIGQASAPIPAREFAPGRFEAAAGFRRDAAQLRASQSVETFVGCYEITDSSAKDKSLPSRFALDLMRADPGANVVRAVSTAGSPDTVIARASWEPLGQSVLAVRVPLPDKMLSMTIRFSAGSAVGVATITGDGPARTAGVTRFACRR
jgi:anti-sigma factor RsiW